MATNNINIDYAYGIGNALIQLAPKPILAQRAPGLSDLAQLGQIWVNVPASAVYMLSSITSNIPNWIDVAGSGTGDFTSITVDPGDVDITSGDLNVVAGDINGGGDLTIDGTTDLDGPVNVTSGGLTTLDSVTATAASPTASAEIDVNVGSATFTGFTTAAAGTQTFTITNSLVTTTSEIFVTVCNEGANDAQMTVTRVKRAAGSFAVTTTNNGAAALNGNVTVTFFVLN